LKFTLPGVKFKTVHVAVPEKFRPPEPLGVPGMLTSSICVAVYVSTACPKAIEEGARTAIAKKTNERIRFILCSSHLGKVAEYSNHFST
jgi:hypothetical protein